MNARRWFAPSFVRNAPPGHLNTTVSPATASYQATISSSRPVLRFAWGKAGLVKACSFFLIIAKSPPAGRAHAGGAFEACANAAGLLGLRLLVRYAESICNAPRH